MEDRPAESHDLRVLSKWAPQLAFTFASVGNDIALVIDSDGVIRNVALGKSELAPSPEAWVGRRWADTVTGSTRKKIEQLLIDVDAGGVSRRSEVNHPGGAGPDIPVAYTAVRLGARGPVLAVGRDLSAIAAIQQRFMQSQRETERGYWRVRQDDARRRRLFRVATDAVLAVDAAKLTILEANRAAEQLFGAAPASLVGLPVSMVLDPSSRPVIEDFLVKMCAGGRPAALHDRLVCGMTRIDVSASLFRGDGAVLILVHARAAENHLDGAERGPQAGNVDPRADAVVIVESSGRVSAANREFLDLCGLSGESQVQGRFLGEWIGDTRHDLPQLVAHAVRCGVVPIKSMSMRCLNGQTIAIDISASIVDDGDQECVGFTIRRRPQRVASGASEVDEIAAALARLGGRVGRVALPDLLRKATDLAERYFLVSTVDRVGGDRAAAAKILGISRASLGQRLRRLSPAAGKQQDGDSLSSLLN